MMNDSNGGKDIRERIEIDRWLDKYEKEKQENPQLDVHQFLGNVDDSNLRNKVRVELNKMVGVVSQLDHTGATQPFDDEELTSDSDLEIGETVGQFIDNYKLLQVIGEGGMGTVYMAEQTQPVQRRVALKIIKLGMDTKEVVARFEAERQALSMMDHPNIAKVLDVGTTENGRPYFVMELVKGLPFTRFCDENKLNLDERLELFKLVCQGVQHAHLRGIIHRDLKPSNILVAEYDNVAVPKIIDFGLAKAVDRRLTDKTMFTQLGQVVGTFSYMSPEQSKMNQLDVDTRTDIYSLGVILYEILTGTTPFDKKRLKSEALDRVLQIIREEDPPVPSMRLSTVDTIPEVAASRQLEPKRLQGILRGELDWIVMKALDKERSRRYETASSFAIDIERYLKGDPVGAAPPSVVYKLRKFVRRNKSTVVAGTLVLLALIVGVIGTSLGMFRAQREHKKAIAAGAIATERLGQTRKALDMMSGQMLDEWLLTRKELTDEQREFLNKIMALYEEFAQESNQEAESMIHVAKAYYRVGQINNRLGETDSAREALQEALDILESKKELNVDSEFLFAQVLASLASLDSRTGNRKEALSYFSRSVPLVKELMVQAPDQLKYHLEHIDQQHSIAILYVADGKFTEGKDAHEANLSALRELSSRFPNETKIAYRISMTLGLLAFEYRYADRENDAIASYHEARQKLNTLVASNPTKDSYRWFLSVVVNDLGVLHKAEKRIDLARPLYKEAMSIRERLHNEYPNSKAYANLFAGSHLNLGNLERIAKNDKLAMSYYEKGIALCEKVVAKDPNDSRARTFARNMNEGIGESYILAQDYSAALKHFEQSIQHHLPQLSASNPAFDVRLPLRRAYIIAKQGDVITAIGITEKTLNTAEPDTLGEASFCAASVFAAAFELETDPAQKERHAIRSVELLKQSIELGSAVSGPKSTDWKNDPELDALRDREDFAALSEVRKIKKKKTD